MNPRLAPLLFALAALAPTGALAEHKCQCLYQGRKFDQGELVCIRVDGSARLARCDTMLNNSSWTFLKTGCPTALLTPIPPTVLPTPLKVD